MNMRRIAIDFLLPILCAVLLSAGLFALWLYGMRW
jgi:hypothetical protein